MDLGRLMELSEHRVCRECGEHFHSDKERTAMQKHVDHLVIHQPTGEQWSNAYKMIKAAQEKKRSEDLRAVS